MRKKTISSFIFDFPVFRKKWMILLFFLSYSIISFGQSIFSGTGNWSNPVRWSAGVPGAGTAVTIASGAVCTVDGTGATCASLTFAANGANSSVTITNNLAVVGAITYSNPSADNRNQTIAVGTGTLSCGSISMVNTSANTRVNRLTISSGSVTVNGNIICSGNNVAKNTLVFSGAGTLNIGGNFTVTLVTFTPNTSTVNYNGGGAQSVFGTTYNNLSLSNAGTKTISGATTVNANLTVRAGVTLALGANNLGTPTSVTLECGAPTGSSITGTGNFTLGGNVTVNDLTTGTGGATIASPVSLGATRIFNVADDGTAATDLTISGLISGAFGVTKTGGGTLNLSASNTYTGITTISTGTLMLGANGGATNTPLGTTGGATTITAGAVLDLNGFTLGTSEALSLNGTGISSGGALINSSGTAATYNGTITLGSAGSIGTTGDITLGTNGIAGGFDLTKVGAGSLSLGSGTTTTNNLIISTGSLTSTTGTLNIAGDFTNSGTFNHNNGTVNFNRAGAQAVAGVTYNNLTLSVSGVKTFGSGVTINGSLSITGASASLVAGATITANTLSLNGVAQSSGTWGSTSSSATYTNNTYFAATTGIVNVSTSSCTAGTWLGTTSTDWNTASNWCGGIPAAATNVIIPSGGNQPTIGAAGGVCNNITINPGATLTISGSNTLTVSGNFTNSGTFVRNTSTVIFNGAAQNIGPGPFHNLTLSGSGTKTLNAGITALNNLILSGTASAAAAANLAISGSLSIGDGTTFTVGAFTLGVTGTTTVGGGTSGLLSITSATGTKTFTGAVTINTGGAITESAAAQLAFGSDVTINGTLTESGVAVVGIAGSMTNNGTYTAGTGVHTFSGAGKTIGGGNAISIPTATFTGAYTNSGTLTVGTLLTINGTTLTNTGSITASTALSGTGGLTNGVSGILNIGGSSGITTLTATAVGNTVNYTGTGQTLKVTAYHHLVLSGGAKTFGTIATIGGNLTLSGTATATTGANLAISGNLSVGDGTTFTVPGFTLGVTGTTTIGAGTSGLLSISNATGTKTFSGAVTVNIGASLTETAAAPIAFGSDVTNNGTITEFGAATVGIAGNFTNNNTYTASTGVHTFSGASKNISGTNTVTIPNLTISGTITNNGTLAVSTTLAGAGTLTNGATGILNFGGASISPTINATTAGNIINYNGVAQAVKATTYDVLILSGSGVKTIGTAVIVNGDMSITGTASVSLANGTTSSANTLTLGTYGQPAGSFGGTGSAATFRNATYFAPVVTGILNVATGTCAAGTWTGATSTDWGTASNWCDGNVPVSSTNVIINSGINQPVINSAAFCNNLLVNSGASLTISGSNSLTISGDLSNSGSFTANTSTVIFDGTTQAVGIGPFYNLTLAGSGVKTLTGTTVNGVLSLEGTATVSTSPTYGASATLQYNTTISRNAGAEWITPFAATGGVIISGTGTITLNAAKVFNTSVPLTINIGASLNTSAANNYALTFGGNFINNGGTLIANGSPVNITGTTLAQTIAGLTTTGTVSMTKTAGTATLQGNVSGDGITINGVGGTLDLGNGLTHTFTGTWTRTNGTLNGGSSLLRIGGSISGIVGTFTSGTGTVEWYAAGAQAAGALTYNNLTVSGSGIKTFATTPTVNGVLSMEGTATITVTGAAVIAYGASATLQYNTATLRTSSSEEWIASFPGTGGVIIANTGVITLDAAKVLNSGVPLIINNGASLNTSAANNYALTFGGNFVNNGGTFTPNASAITITGTMLAQTISGFTTTGVVSVTKTLGTATLQGNISGSGLTINGIGGTLDLGSGFTHTFTGTWTRTNGTLNGGSSLLRLGGGLSGIGGIFIPGTGTVEYNSAVAQPVAGVSYNNLIISGSGVKTLGGNSIVDGNLTLSSGSLAVAAFSLTLNGPAITGTPSSLTTTAASSLAFGGSFTGVAIPSSVTLLSNLTINNPSGVTLSSNLNISNTLTLSGGILTVSPAQTISIISTAPGSVVATSGSYIDGSLSRAMVNAGGTYLFPVGSSACDSHWLTFSNLVGVAPVIKVTFSCNGATTGDATIANPMPINTNWHVERTSGTFTNATVKLDGNEIDFSNSVAQSSAQAGTYTRKTSTAAIGSVSANTIGAIATDTWFGIGSSTIKTLYSYQNGSWSSASTWTTDPSGTTQVGSSIPVNNDNIVILSGRTVTLPANIASTGLNLTIEEGSFLDIAAWQFTAGLASLSGQGTLKIAASYFPTVTTNTFVNAGGGTTEFRTNINLPSQSIYNNLTIDASGLIVTQTINLTLNGDLYLKGGTFQINDNTTRRLRLTVMGDVTVDPGTTLRVGTGVTNSVTNPLTIAAGGTAPFIDYYDLHSHRIVLNGDLINNGTVKFTNLAYPVYNAFPPTILGATTGFATVYFQGASDNLVQCGGTTDFYNLVVDKGIDQTFKLTIYTSGSSYANFRLFGANIAGADGGGVNPNLKKALWIRTGTLVLEGLTIIPSLTEGNAANLDFYIPANGALVLNGADVIVLSTADDFREVNLAYNTTALSNAAMGIVGGGTGSALSLYGRLQIDNGYLSTRESAGILTSSVSPGQFIINNGTVDAKQFLGSTGSASYQQNGGFLILRGRFQRTPTAYSSVSNLTDFSSATLNPVRAASGISGTYGSFNLNNANNVFAMSGGTIRIYDICGDGTVAAQQKAFDVLASTANCNVTGGTLEMIPTTGSVPASNSPNFLITTNSVLGNLTINRASSTSVVQLSTNPLVLLKDLTLTSGDFNANSLNVTIGGNAAIASTWGTYTTGATNTTIFSGTGKQTFTIDLAGALPLNNFKTDKAAGDTLFLKGTFTTINVAGDLSLYLGTIDNGKTINVSKNVYNSGVYSGAGKILLNGTIVQTIGGNGIFNNLDLNNTNAAAAPVSLTADMTITGLLNLVSNKIFNIGTYKLNIGTAGSISATGFSNSCYIHTSGQAGDGGVTKSYSSNTPFLFPLGSFSTRRAAVYGYTPATIEISGTPSTYGSITVIPVGYEHPATTNNNRSLTYYWRVKSNGFVLGAATVTHSYNYSQSDVVGPGPVDPLENGYVAARYNSSAYSWTKGTVNDVDDVTNNIIGEPGTGTFLQGVTFIDGDYTAGDDNPTDPFGTPTKFYSRVASGNWSTPATWSNTGHGGAAAITFPGQNDIVIIGNGNTVNLTANASCASLQIETGSVLDIYTYTGGNFGMVLTHPNGNGLFRVTTPPGNPGRLFTFPTGDFTDFNLNDGTTEYYDIDGSISMIYVLPASVTSYGNLILTAKGEDNLVFPNNNYTTINGDLTCTGNATTAWIAMSWSNATLYGPASVEKTVYVKGDMFVNAGTFIFMNDNNAAPQHLIVDGDLVVAPGALIDHFTGFGANPANTVAIGGSLINNSSVANSIRFLNGTRYADVTFFGSDDGFLTNTVGTPTTIFNSVTIDKGTSQTSKFTINIGGTLTTKTDNWLTLKNGTLRFMRTNPGTDFTINAATPLTIPATAGLYIDYANSGNKNVLIANNPADASDFYLNGKLTVKNGNVYIGSTTPTTINFGNDIEYSGGGFSEIEVTGGNLYINGNIRRNPSVSNGVLKYTQSGGSVFIYGNAAIPNPANAKLEVLNTGSSFNMSSGSITIVKGGGTTFGDMYIRPATGTVTGGEIIFAHDISGSNQQYLIDATIPLNNLTVTGRTAAAAATATVKLMVNPLILNGNLTLTNTQSRFDANSVYNIPVTIKGNFTNNGVYNHYNNVTTFSRAIAGTQLILGTSATDFYDLTVSPQESLTLTGNITVLNDLSLLTGRLLCETYKTNVGGDIINDATFENTSPAGGLVMNGTTQQHISGTGTFGLIELNNSAGSTLDNSITLNEDLILSAGIFDISQYLLTLSVNSDIIANGTPFGTSKMITSDGVWSNVGISKFFASPLTTVFTYPLGSPGKYTPAVLTITANGNVGSIRINGINSRHPAVVDPLNVLKYYWEVESTGILGLTGNLVLNYKSIDVTGGPESAYVASLLLSPSTNWSKAASGPATDNVNETSHYITFNFNNSSNLTGEYTAGNDLAIPSIVPQYTTNKSGNWSDKTIWDYTGTLPAYPCPDGGPNGFSVTINHEVTADANYSFAFKTTINNKLKVISGYFGHNFGTVDGNGTLYLESASFPAGRYDSFLSCAGSATLEYGGSGTYDINATLYSSVPKILISGTGTRVLPDKDLTICNQLKIDDEGLGTLTLDNSIYNRNLIINGTFERYNSGIFKSGSGSSKVIFSGTSLQSIGGLSGDFTGTSAFNNFEINNSSGLVVNNNGTIEINGNLLLTNGLISTTSTNRLIINNFSVSCVFPEGGSASSYIDGPLIKKLNQGDPSFRFPVGKKLFGIGNNLSLRATQAGTLFWIVEYINPSSYSSTSGLLTAANTKEYWTVSGVPGTSKAYVDISWNSSSSLTPLMTQNGISDMRVAEHDGTNWIEIASSATAGSNNTDGSAETTARTTITSGLRNYTLACVNTPRPTVRMAPTGPVCGNSPIPVTLTSSLTIVGPFTINYTEDGTPKSINPASFPASIPTTADGKTYILTSFTYYYPAGTLRNGAIDPSSLVTYSLPTASDAGSNQSNCGATTTVLQGNSPSTGTGLWTIISGTGGTIVSPTSHNSAFNGTNGTSYTLRWTISNGTCTSADDVVISFPLLPVATFSYSGTPYCSNGTDPLPAFSGGGAAGTFSSTAGLVFINTSTGEVDLSASTPGDYTITNTIAASGGCPLTVATSLITINALPTATISYTGSPWCNSEVDQSVTLTGTTGGTFSALAGLTINSSSGDITPSSSAAGTYTVTYSIPAAGGCGIVTTTTSVTITAEPSATIAYSGSPWCANELPQAVVLTGTTGGTFSAPAGLTINSGSGTITPSSSTSGTYTVTYTVAAAGGCSIFSTITDITISNSLTWTGTINTDWNNTGNWSCGYIPAASTIVIIPDVPNKPVIGAGITASVNNLTVDLGSTLTLNDGTIQIAGTITNDGTITATTGQIEMNGSVAQVIGANVFAGNTIKDLTINNASGVSLSGPLNVTGTVLVSAGNLASAGNLTLISDAAGTALISGAGNGNVTGNVTMQRYLSDGFGYKYFSSPMQGAKIAQFGDDMMALTSTNLYKYVEDRPASGWVTYSNIDSLIRPLRGYAVNFGNLHDPRTVDITTPVNNGDLAITLKNNSRPVTNGFHLIGNPYPSPIDWDIVVAGSTNIDLAAYFFKASATAQYGGTYSSYVNGVSSIGSSNLDIIQSMQGFFAHVTTGTTGVLRMTNAARIVNFSQPFVAKKGGLKTMSAKGSPPAQLKMTLRYSDDMVYADPMILYIDDKGTPDFEGDVDALKLLNTDLQMPNIYSVAADGAIMSINALSPITEDFIQLPLGIKLNRAAGGTVIFKLQEIDPSLAGMRVFMSDIVAGVEQDLLPNQEYTITLPKGEYLNRFYLNFSNILTSKQDIETGQDIFKAFSSDGILKAEVNRIFGDKGEITVFNFAGQKLFSEKIYVTGYHEFNTILKEGIYIVNYSSGSYSVSKKLFIERR